MSMAKSKLDFLRGFIKLVEHSEVPEIFALWCGIAGVSCALGRKVWIDWGLFNIFPNFYIVLVAGSGLLKKSTAINRIEAIVRELDPRPNIISQKITSIGLIDAMRVRERKIDKRIVKDTSQCEGYVFTDELNVFLNRRSFEEGLGTLLIPLYDCKENFEYRTKSRGVEEIRDACLGMLSGSTVAFVKMAIPEEAINVGLVSRIIFVYTDTPTPPVHKPSFDNALHDKLVLILQRMQKLSGRANVSEELLAFHKQRYDHFRMTSPMLKDPALVGYASRRFVHAMKIALVLAVVENEELSIEQKHLAGALEILAENEQEMGRVIELITTSESGVVLENVYSKIAKSSVGITRTSLMRLVSHKVDSKKLSEIMQTLIGSGRVSSTIKGKGTWYKATEILDRRKL